MFVTLHAASQLRLHLVDAFIDIRQCFADIYHAGT